ncbi:phosphotransferase [Nonomuraea endophytica]|uniref:phosphotransferase n=1 Tax=Nonomuraea endophytica TaxID=714136 RepID=UPI0037CCBBEC
MRPSDDVLAAFGLAGPARPLDGGQGESFRAGDAVLKPAGDVEEAEWAARVLGGLPGGDGFRVPRPLRTRDGGHVADGWSATEFTEGTPGPGDRWADLLAAGRAFHRALRHVPRPALLDRREHAWAVADRIAWEEREPPQGPAGLLERLRRIPGPAEAPSQLVHGDLTGNVLFHPGRPPAVIDFSPYWRPPGYAEAVVVADGLLYHGADPALVEEVDGGARMVARALVFRLATSVLLPVAIPRKEVERFARATGVVEAAVR